jgi:hypothetical protein
VSEESQPTRDPRPATDERTEEPVSSEALDSELPSLDSDYERSEEESP